MPSIVFIYVGNIKVCLDSIGGGFYISFRVALIERDMCQWDNCYGVTYLAFIKIKKCMCCLLV